MSKIRFVLFDFDGVISDMPIYNASATVNKKSDSKRKSQ